jgi:hypothetical protein
MTAALNLLRKDKRRPSECVLDARKRLRQQLKSAGSAAMSSKLWCQVTPWSLRTHFREVKV